MLRCLCCRTCVDCWDKPDPLATIGPYECTVAAACLENNTCFQNADGIPVMDGPLCGRCRPGCSECGQL